MELIGFLIILISLFIVGSIELIMLGIVMMVVIISFLVLLLFIFFNEMLSSIMVVSEF